MYVCRYLQYIACVFFVYFFFLRFGGFWLTDIQTDLMLDWLSVRVSIALFSGFWCFLFYTSLVDVAFCVFLVLLFFFQNRNQSGTCFFFCVFCTHFSFAFFSFCLIDMCVVLCSVLDCRRFVRTQVFWHFDILLLCFCLGLVVVDFLYEKPFLTLTSFTKITPE